MTQKRTIFTVSLFAIVVLMLGAVCGLGGCDGGGGGDGSGPTAPAPTVALSVSPTSITVGQSVTLSWSSTNTTACTASGAWSGSEPTTGSQSITPTAAGNTTYTLTCTGSGGTASTSANLTVTAPPQAPEPSGLPPDPGEAGKVTLKGIDSDNDGVRDDVQRYIELTVTDSARHREALRSVARATQRELLAQTKEEAIQVAIEGVRTIECLSYLGMRKQYRWKEVDALMLNTEARLRAMEAHNDHITGQVFTSLPDSLRRSACTFDVEALPN